MLGTQRDQVAQCLVDGLSHTAGCLGFSTDETALEDSVVVWPVALFTLISVYLDWGRRAKCPHPKILNKHLFLGHTVRVEELKLRGSSWVEACMIA